MASKSNTDLIFALERAHRALARAAKEASDLAKKLGDRPEKRRAYGIKNLCLSELLRSDVGAVNDVRPDGKVGLDIPGRRLHTKPSELDLDVQAIVRRQIPMVPVSAPLSDRISPDQITLLRNIASTRSHAA